MEKRKRNVTNLLSAELVMVNKYVSPRYSGHMMTCEQKKKKKNRPAKDKWILHELLATRSAAQAIQNNKTATSVRKECASL